MEVSEIIINNFSKSICFWQGSNIRKNNLERLEGWKDKREWMLSREKCPKNQRVVNCVSCWQEVRKIWTEEYPLDSQPSGPWFLLRWGTGDQLTACKEWRSDWMIHRRESVLDNLIMCQCWPERVYEEKIQRTET